MANGLPLTQYSAEQLQDVVDKSQAVDNMMTFDDDGELLINGVYQHVEEQPSLTEFTIAVHELVSMISDPA